MKKILILMMIALLTAICLGCSSRSSISDVGNSSAQSGAVQESEMPLPDTATTDREDQINSDSVFVHDEVHETWESGVSVDATVLSINREQLSTYTGKLRAFSSDEIMNALGLSRDNVKSSQTMEHSLEGYIPGRYDYFQFNDSSFLVCNMARFSFSADTFSKIRGILVTEGTNKNSQLFQTGNDLEFASIDEAEEAVSAFIDSLNLSVIKEPTCYTLDYNTLSAENERQYEVTKELAAGLDQEVFSPPKLDITESDACYLLSYPVAIDDLPLSPYPNGVYGDGSLLPGTELTVCYGNKGISGVSLEYLPEIEEKSEAQPILSLADVLEKEKEKYASIILNGEYQIYEIRLEYVMQPLYGEDNMYQFIPVWRFGTEHHYTISQSKTGDSSTLRVVDKGYDLFNAITGEELAFDMG